MNPPSRLEINDFVKNQVHFSLFVQALQKMYGQDQNNVLKSYFQLAAIHGEPNMIWNNSGDPKRSAGGFRGYCTHGTTLFPTWHRPYVALFEQIIQENALAIAETYIGDNAVKFRSAALDLRVPYWDWGANIIPPAQIITQTVVEILCPSGVLRMVPNPFLSYRFHPTPTDFVDNFQIWPQTLRYPTSAAANAISNEPFLVDTLQPLQSLTRGNTFRLLTDDSLKTWPAFSNASPNHRLTNSLEGIHDLIHLCTPGIVGHMGVTDVSAFDPIFWLHHANVDRLLSLWSAINPEVWVSVGKADQGTWTIPTGADIDINTDLTPFWKDADQKKYWRSTDITTTESLGYIYPEFKALLNATEPQVQAAIKTFVQQKYGPRTSSIPVQTASDSLMGGRPAIPFHEWSVRVRVRKFALQGSFSVVFFLGPVPANAHEWHKSPSFAGAHAIFSSSNLVSCGNCRAQAHSGFIVQGFVHLNIARPELAAMDPESVKAYLRENLSWRVLHPKRHPVHSRDVPSLEVLVHVRRMWTNPGDTLPFHGEPQWFPEITEGWEF
ncbi:tyrosinase [Mycena capillaripes]|nr:tyrosinase [Mycena capillaripes]